MNVTGVDLSLTSTGVADDRGVRTIKVKLQPHASPLQRITRLHTLVVHVDRACRGADVVVMEGYGFNAQHSHAHSLGELGGAVKLVLYQRHIPFVIIPPTSLKRFATGKGNANKDQVLVAAVQFSASNGGPQIQSNDEADAYFLRLMGLAHYQQQDVIAPSYRRQAVTAVDWPRLEERQVASG